jgi:hypothetical protein
MQRVRRLVTGHNENGESVFLSVGEPPQFHTRRGPGVEFFEFWRTTATPVPLSERESREPNERLPLRIPPDPDGTIIRILDIHPGHVQYMPPRADGRHRGMHRTETLDYGIMIEGELWLLLDNTEQQIRPGDVVIQRGTDHAWENRSDETARIAFVLIDGKFTGSLAEHLKGAELMHGTLPLRERAK